MIATYPMPAETQISARMDPAVKVQFDAIARTLDMPLSRILRDVLEGALPAWRKRASGSGLSGMGRPGGGVRLF